MGLHVSQVGAALVTRGDVDMAPIVAALPFTEIAIWDNSDEADLSVFGRYAAAAQLKRPVVLTQDDDVILPADTVKTLLAAYKPGAIICNVPERFRDHYTDSGLVGFGAIFDKALISPAFERFERGAGEIDADWLRRCSDLIFTMLAGPLVFLDLAYVELEHAHHDTRMWKQPNHSLERKRMRELCRRIR